jgi:hypothetical protein
VGVGAGVGGGIGGAASTALGSVLRCKGGSLILDWGEDLGWSTTADLDVGFALARAVCCNGCTGLDDAGTEGVIVGTLVWIPLLIARESSGTSSIVTFGRGLAGGVEDCDGRTGIDLMIS